MATSTTPPIRGEAAEATGTPDVSVVVPVFRNAETLRELHGRLHRVLEAEDLGYEMIFVDDACPAGSLAVLIELSREDPTVTVVALEHNVGQQRAVLAGLGQARGRWVVVMDADLQDAPEAIPELLGRLREGPAAVFAGRRGRYESAFRLLTSRLFKGLLHLLAAVPADAGLFVAMDRQMVERLLAPGAAGPFVVAMNGRTGLPLVSIPVARAPRPGGQSSYSSWRRLRTALLALGWVLAWRWRETPGLEKKVEP